MKITFDGDELNGLLITDMDLFKPLSLLAPHYGVFDLHKPEMISKGQSLPTPVVSTLCHWFNEQIPRE